MISAFARRVNACLCNDTIDILQINVGRLCNLECHHCHLSCGPTRKEIMSKETMQDILEVVRNNSFSLIDITGGAPEMNTNLKYFIDELSEAGSNIQLRTNLVALLEEDDLMPFLYKYKVALVASLPCYLEENITVQRGAGVYKKSIECLKRLNALGYGEPGGVVLDLVYNPNGPFLPGSQSELEEAYRKELKEQHGIFFSHLYTITNLPIGRFAESIRKENKEDEYIKLLEHSFNPETVPHLMCRRQVCVDWDGKLYDCDFNLSLGLMVNDGYPNNIKEFDYSFLRGRAIVTGDHCFGCTAGLGSSCGGTLT